jgi:2-oxoglutarate dehydrogenase complex dehydrogenase (E1) component-like enzyme
VGGGPHSEVLWAQEEPANAGAWAWAEAHAASPPEAGGSSDCLGPITFAGRPALAAPAVGLPIASKAQQEAVLSAPWE